MKAVVFGGSGFLGSHVADVLSEKKYKVIVYDSKKSAYLKESQEMVIGNILDEDLVNKTVKDCQVVYNFAGIADIEECVSKPLETVKYNVLGNSVILEAVRLNEAERYLFASSSYVYSNYGSFYKSSKQACELFIQSYHEKYNLPYTILRYGSLYGNRADDTNSIHRIIKEALSTNRIVYHGTGEEIREYIHVRDAAELSVKALDPEFLNQKVMLTGVSAMRYKDILEMIKEILGNKINLVFTNKINDTHYKTTPYNYKKPDLGRKLFNEQYIELGAGLLECIEDVAKTIDLHK